MRMEARATPDGTATVTVNGQAAEEIKAASLDEARRLVLKRATEMAARVNRDVTLTAGDPDGVWIMVVTPDGRTIVPPPEAKRHVPLRAVSPEEPSLPEPRMGARVAQAPAKRDWQEPGGPEVRSKRAEPRSEETARRTDSSDSGLPQLFLPEQSSQLPATKGWRGVLTRIGLRMAPGLAEQAEREDAHAVSQHWPGVRTIAVVNGKGGTGKTPSAAFLSAVFARYGASGVIAWDVNHTRGTLGWRTEQGPHHATTYDLLPQGERLLGAAARSADLSHFVHHQTRDRYDVLRSQPIRLTSDQRVRPSDVDLVWRVAAKYYRLIVIDTGNDESDPVWSQVVERADQIVVPTTTRMDHAEAGAMLLNAMGKRDEHCRKLAKKAVVVITQADPKDATSNVASITNGFTQFTQNVAVIPYDPAMAEGALQWEALRPSTRRAWLSAAATVARQL